MEEVKQNRRLKKQRIYQICQRVLECVRAKIRMASSCSVREISYVFRTVNFHGCPMISHKRALNMQKYVVQKLQKEGFNVEEHPAGFGSEDDAWKIRVYWK